MSFEITDELAELVDEHRHYKTEATARHLAAYICEELEDCIKVTEMNSGEVE